eukprot:4150020-Pleurochrysis_carterae.AAC.2
MPELYSAELLDVYREILSVEERAPHVYALAARVYQKAMASGMDQAIVVSGESGAGKTETTKHLLHFVAEATNAAREQLHERVMGTNPITESFGCARTVRNDNRWRAPTRERRVRAADLTNARMNVLTLALAQSNLRARKTCQLARARAHTMLAHARMQTLACRHARLQTHE